MVFTIHLEKKKSMIRGKQLPMDLAVTSLYISCFLSPGPDGKYITKLHTQQPTRWPPGDVSYTASTATHGCLLPVMARFASSPHCGRRRVHSLWLFSCWGSRLWRLKGNPSKKRTRGRVLAFDGSHFVGKRNNQPIFGVRDTLIIEEGV